MLKKSSNTFRLFLLFFVAIVFFPDTNLFAAKKQRNWRFGFSRFINTVEYSYKTKRRSGDGGEIDTSVEHVNKGVVYSTAVSLEYLFGKRKKSTWFGLQFDKGLSTGNRHFSFVEENSYNGGKTKIGDIHQKIFMDYLMGFNFFFPDATDEKINFSLGFLNGQISINHKYKNGGERDDTSTDSWIGLNKTQTSTLTIPLKITKVGVEFIMETGGLRLDILLASKKYFGINDLMINNSDNLGNINNSTEPQTEIVALKGGLSLSIFRRF